MLVYHSGTQIWSSHWQVVVAKVFSDMVGGGPLDSVRCLENKKDM